MLNFMGFLPQNDLLNDKLALSVGTVPTSALKFGIPPSGTLANSPRKEPVLPPQTENEAI
jgi:hypothetical protein